MEDLNIYVATQKAITPIEDPHYIPIQTGAALHPDLGLARDDAGDHISQRNPYYAELTALYWIWKNASTQHVGLMHYRRFFFAKTDHILYRGQYIASGVDIAHQLRTSNIVVVKPLEFTHHDSTLPRSVEQQFVGTHHSLDLLQAREVIGDTDSRYLPAFDFVMRNNQMVPFNIIVTSIELLDAYCSWLFGVLFPLEGCVSPASIEDPQQSRVMGFLAERLLTVWMARNRRHLRIDYRPYAFYTD